MVSFISAYLIGYPDAPTSVYGAQEASDHLGGERIHVPDLRSAHRLLQLLLRVVPRNVHSVLRRAEGEGVCFSSVALAGSVIVRGTVVA